MLNEKDQENLTKAAQTAELLRQDLCELVKSENPFLSDIALELLESASAMEQRLKRMGTYIVA